jgi:hypothetical protein
LKNYNNKSDVFIESKFNLTLIRKSDSYKFIKSQEDNNNFNPAIILDATEEKIKTLESGEYLLVVDSFWNEISEKVDDYK